MVLCNKLKYFVMTPEIMVLEYILIVYILLIIEILRRLYSNKYKCNSLAFAFFA